MPIVQPAIALSARQEAFCRHYAVSGNAADAARQAGYSGRSARQTDSGHWIVRFAGIDLGIIDRRTKKLHGFRPVRPGRAKAERTKKTVTHVSGLSGRGEFAPLRPSSPPARREGPGVGFSAVQTG